MKWKSYPPEQKGRRAAWTGKLFKDSLMKDLEPFLRKSGASEVQLTSLPGRGNSEIMRAVKKAPTAKSDLVMYRNDGTEGATQPLI